MSLFPLSEHEAGQTCPPPWKVAVPKKRRRPRRWREKDQRGAARVGLLRRLRVEWRDVLILLAAAAVAGAIWLTWSLHSKNWVDQLGEPNASFSNLAREK